MNDTATQTSIIPNRSQRRKAMAHQGFLNKRKTFHYMSGLNYVKKLEIKERNFTKLM